MKLFVDLYHNERNNELRLHLVQNLWTFTVRNAITIDFILYRRYSNNSLTLTICCSEASHAPSPGHRPTSVQTQTPRSHFAANRDSIRISNTKIAHRLFHLFSVIKVRSYKRRLEWSGAATPNVNVGWRKHFAGNRKKFYTLRLRQSPLVRVLFTFLAFDVFRLDFTGVNKRGMRNLTYAFTVLTR